MKRHFGRLFAFATLCAACSPSGSAGPDGGSSLTDGGSSSIYATLSLVAGGLGGSGTLDGAGSAARFTSPAGLVADSSGNVYVADGRNHTIRKVVLTTGAVTTIAGSARNSGSSDGVGAAGRFNVPRGLAFDGNSSLYVADSLNHTIRVVLVTTGETRTLAGSAGQAGSSDGVGAAARFNTPYAVTLDGSGNLLVADSGNHAIRKLAIASGQVVTVAGSGSAGSSDGIGTLASFRSPQGLVSDGSDSVYIADSANYTVRKLALSSGTVTTLAGLAGVVGAADGSSSFARFNLPGGLALDGAGNLYIADANNQTLRKLVLGSGSVTTFAGQANTPGATDGVGGAARLYSPQGLAVSGTLLLVADSANSTLRRVDLGTSSVSTFAGAAPAPGSLDGSGSAARFSSPYYAVADAAGNVYVSDAANHTLRKVVLSSGAVSTLAGTAGSSGFKDGVGAAATFNAPSGLALDGAGNLYVADTNNKAIRKVVLASATVSTAATSAKIPFVFPQSLALDAAGNLYVADVGSYTIHQVATATGTSTELAGSLGTSGSSDGVGAAASFGAPCGVALDSRGNLYVSDASNQTIRQVVVASGAVSTIAGASGMVGSSDGSSSAARFNRPCGLAYDPANALLIADGSNGLLRRLDLGSGQVTTQLGRAGQYGVKLGATPAGLSAPVGVSVVPSGGVLITDENSLLLAR